jgi:hypothetical protein
MRKMIFLIFFLAVACTSGCQLGSASNSGPQNFSVDIPEGWTRYSSSEYFLLTKEGLFSQYILVQQRRVNKPFSHTKKRLKKDMPPKEAAGIILDEMSSDDNLLNFKTIEYIPTRVGRYNGFRIVFRYQDKDGRKFRTVFCGILKGYWFYSLRYCAQEAKYSDKDMEAFKKVVNSFNIVMEK